MQILKRKIDNIKEAGPDILVIGNPGCLIQIQHGLNQEGLQVELLHTATFLRRACGT
jgi:glycolate oxidase iron-sulfur subunit